MNAHWGCCFADRVEKILQMQPDTAVIRGVKNAGIFTANGEKNKSKEKRQELYGFGRNLI